MTHTKGMFGTAKLELWELREFLETSECSNVRFANVTPEIVTGLCDNSGEPCRFWIVPKLEGSIYPEYKVYPLI